MKSHISDSCSGQEPSVSWFPHHSHWSHVASSEKLIATWLGRIDTIAAVCWTVFSESSIVTICPTATRNFRARAQIRRDRLRPATGRTRWIDVLLYKNTQKG